MKTYSKFKPTAFDRAGAFLRDQQDWLVVPVSQTRDSGPLDQSNFATALETLGGESKDCEVCRFGHWGPGWFEIIIINPASAKLVELAESIESSLANYPVLSDDDYSRREHEDYLESWNNWGRRDYTKALRSKLFSDFANGVSEEFTDDEIESALDDLSTEEIDGLRDTAAQSVNWEYQSEGSGVSINVSGLVDKTDTDKLADLLVEICRENLKSAEITKLAKVLGAPDDIARYAVAQGYVLVSQIRALITGPTTN